MSWVDNGVSLSVAILGWIYIGVPILGARSPISAEMLGAPDFGRSADFGRFSSDQAHFVHPLHYFLAEMHAFHQQ